MKIGDKVTVTDGSQAHRLDKYELNPSIGTSKDIFEVIHKNYGTWIEVNGVTYHDIYIKNIKTDAKYLHSKKFLKLVQLNYKQLTLDKWFWFMTNPNKGSYDYQTKMNKPKEGKINNNCWACELVKEDHILRPNCDKCPIKAFRTCNCFSSTSLYQQWESNKTSANAREVYNAILTTWEE